MFASGKLTGLNLRIQTMEQTFWIQGIHILKNEEIDKVKYYNTVIAK